MARQLQPCGTPAAYRRHLRHGEQPCDACRDAMRAYQKKWLDRTGYMRARNRALSRLAARRRGEFRRLLLEELAKETGRS